LGRPGSADDGIPSVPSERPPRVNGRNRLASAINLLAEGIHDNGDRLDEAIREATVFGLSRSGAEVDMWEEYGGVLLVWLANQRYFLSLQLFKMVSLFSVHAPDVVYKPSFPQESYIGGFCRDKADEIDRVLISNHLRSWSARIGAASTDSGIHLSAVKDTFVADMPMYCPQRFNRGNHVVDAIALLHRLHRHRLVADRNSGVNISIRGVIRSRTFLSSFEALVTAEPEVLRRGISGVSYQEEAGIGNGMIRDWFSMFARDSLSDQVGLFKLRKDELPAFRYINPDISPTEIGMWGRIFEAIGRFMALAIVHEIGIGYDFPIMFYAKLLNRKISLEDLMIYEPEVAQSMRAILNAASIEEMLIDEIEIDGTAHPLTMENRNELVDRYINSRIPLESLPFLMSIQKGLFDVIPEYVFENTSPETLRLILLGTSELDVDELQRLTDYDVGYDAAHVVIRNFWTVLRSFDSEMKSKFLFFLTSSAHLPLGGLQALGKRFKIQQGSNTRGYPTTATCFFTLRLPPYDSIERLRERLVVAIQQGGDGVFRS
jgi:ubiquitin-protein ligase E3 A